MIYPVHYHPPFFLFLSASPRGTVVSIEPKDLPKICIIRLQLLYSPFQFLTLPSFSSSPLLSGLSPYPQILSTPSFPFLGVMFDFNQKKICLTKHQLVYYYQCVDDNQRY